MLQAVSDNSSNPCLGCLCCLSPLIIILGAFLFILYNSSKAKNTNQTDQTSVHQIKQVETIKQLSNDELLKNLISSNEKVRMEASFSIKDRHLILLGQLIPMAATNYANYKEAEVAVNRTKNVRRTGNLAADMVIASKVSSAKSRYNNAKIAWESTMNGVKLYVYNSSSNLKSGLEEFASFVGNNTSNANIEQAELFTKYCGITIAEPLIELAKDSDEKVRSGSLIMLSALNDIRSYEVIRHGINDESVNVRNIAAAIISKLNIPMSVDKTIYKEIVKMPCQYCGTMVDITEKKCPSCGAPFKP